MDALRGGYTIDFSAVLTDRIDARPGNRKRTDLKLYQVSNKETAIRTLRPPVAMGLYSIYEYAKRNKYIDQKHWSYTPGEMVREYLSYLMREYQPNRKTVGYDRESKKWLLLNPPYYFGGYHAGDLVHVDITSCYYNIYRRTTYDTKFSYHYRAPGLGRVPFDKPDWLALQSKAFKRGVGGTIIRHQSSKWIGGNRVITEPSFNKFLAPELWGYMMCTLHCIAHELVHNFGAYYFAVDGAIVDADMGDAVQQYLWDHWQLPSHIKHGPGRGEIRGIGSYDIWPHKGGHRHHTRPYSTLDDNDGHFKYDVEISRKLRNYLVWLENRGM